MNSNTFVKWLFSPKGSGVIADPDLSSPSPSKSHPASTSNAPSHPNQVAENDVNEELKRVILQESCLIKLDRGSNCEAENGTIGVAGEQAEGENGSWGETEKEEKYNKEETCGGSVEIDTKYPVRPDAEDCAYYMKTGTCKFGSGCCFNHPSAVPRKVQAGIYESDHGEAAKHYVLQVECKYYLSPGGCKWGKACKFSHWSTTEFNFLGLPIRPGEKECMYFMRTGTCKYAATCRFNHPDPTSTDGGDRDKLKPPVEYSNSSSRLESPPPPSPPQFPASAIPWSSPAEAMMYSSSPTQSPKPEWNNGCQFPVNQAAAAGQSSSKIAPSPLYILHNWTAENHTIYTNQHQMEMNDYPERPGQPECMYFMKSGDCKFKSNCKFHHPKERISKSPHHANNHGFRLGTDPSICVHYRRYGICRFGPSCKFNHPVNIDDPSRSRRIEDHQQSSPSRTTGDSVSAWPSSRPHVISL